MIKDRSPERGRVARTLPRFGIGPAALLAAPALLWLVGTLYLPVLAPGLSLQVRWLLAGGLVVLSTLSLAAHVAAHIVVARLLGTAPPPYLPLGPLGDAAQAWPPAPNSRREALSALAGPLASAALAALAALVWRAQFAPTLDAVALFVAAVNGALAALNLAPAYPFDGGRLLRLALLGAVRRPGHSASVAGWALAVALLSWGGYVAATRSRLSAETALALVALAALIIAALAGHPAPPEPALRRGRVRLGRGLAALLSLALILPALALTPTPHGLYAPGGAVPVAPMIEVPTLALEPSAGALLATTVIGQTPILAGQWLAGRIDPAITIVPPEQVVPPSTSPQELMAQNARMLDESEVVATVVALNLAGYDATLTGSGAQVLSVLPESPASGLLRPGDRIVTLNSEPVRTTSDLLVALGGLQADLPVAAVVVRGGQTLSLALPLLPPAQPGGPPRIGITTATADLAVEAPVQVRVQPYSIIGGPSAGLMFTLAIYDRLTPGDLTGGLRIAGTGTVSQDGTVGPIGGVAQKVAAAERAGAAYFLAPLENAADARRVARRITVIEVGHVTDALAALQRISRAPELPAQP
jgi:Lon-like protease